MPAITSLAVLLFLGTWNQFMIAIVLIQDPYQRTMAGALQGFVGQYSTDVVLLNVGALLIMARSSSCSSFSRSSSPWRCWPARSRADPTTSSRRWGAGAARTQRINSGTRSPTLQEFRT